jgi:hypothetical protein
MMKYAIVQPHFGMGTVIALSQTQPVALTPLIVVELRGHYRIELGLDCPYEPYAGGYREALVDTSGT